MSDPITPSVPDPEEMDKAIDRIEELEAKANEQG